MHMFCYSIVKEQVGMMSHLQSFSHVVGSNNYPIQIIFKRQEESLASSLLDIICHQN